MDSGLINAFRVFVKSFGAYFIDTEIQIPSAIDPVNNCFAVYFANSISLLERPIMGLIFPFDHWPDGNRAERFCI